jgi:outer membrane receptor for ferrienterochelin and colicin
LSGISTKVVRNENRTVFADTVVDRSGNRVPRVLLALPADTRLNRTGGKWAGFAELEWNPNPLVQVTGGWRADYYDFLNAPLFMAPRAGVKVRITEKHTLRASGGVYFQSPSYVWTVNPYNMDLKAMENRMAVLGWDVLLRPDTRMSVEGYFKRYSSLPAGTLPGVTDYVVMTNTGTSYGGREDDFQSFGYFNLVSSGKGASSGLELSVQKKFSSIPLYGLFSLAWNRSEIKAPNGKTYPSQFDQHWIVNLSGGYIFNNKWEASAKFRFFTGIPYTPVYRPSENPVRPGTTENLPAEYLSARLGPGHSLDVRVDRTFNFPKVTLIVYVDVQNVYNYKNPMKPSYDFWADRIITTGEIGILPSIGISLEI